MKYKYKPIMWNHQYNHNLLFIGSVYDDSLEYIDLRENKQRWKVILNSNISLGLTPDRMLRKYNYRLCLGRC